MGSIADSSIDHAHFKHFAPGEYNNWIRIGPMFGVTGSRLKSAASEATCLAESAQCFFAGDFPSPLYFADDLKSLPWHDEYHSAAAGETWCPKADLIGTEVSRVAIEIGPVDSLAECPHTYDSKFLCASEKTVLQGLAVETMLLADGCIDLLLEAKVVASLPWLCQAYKRIIDCARQAQHMLDSPYAWSPPLH